MKQDSTVESWICGLTVCRKPEQTKELQLPCLRPLAIHAIFNCFLHIGLQWWQTIHNSAKRAQIKIVKQTSSYNFLILISRHSKSNSIELNFNRTQSNSIHGLSSIKFDNRTKSNSSKRKKIKRTQTNVRFSNSWFVENGRWKSITTSWKLELLEPGV